MAVYGTGVYGAGIFGIGDGDGDGDIPTPRPPYVHRITTAQLGDSGIVLAGDADEYGVRWGWQAGTDPWSPGPAQREVSGARGSAHGRWNATEYLEERAQEFTVTVHAPSHEELHRAAQRWQTAISRFAFPVVVNEPHFGRRLSLMRRDGRPTWTEMVSSEHVNVARATASLVADDPLIYGEALRTASTEFPSTTGGRAWPTRWPGSWDAQVETGLLHLTNDGSEETPVLWRIDGPVSSPSVTDVATGRGFRLDMDLPAGEFVTVNTQTRRVLAMGQPQASRRTQWSGSWLGLVPGESTVSFSGAEGGAGAGLSASWRDAWV